MKYRMSIFRKVAIASWNQGGDPSVYGFLDIDMTSALQYLRNTGATELKIPHLVLKAISRAMKEVPELRAYLKFNQIKLRPTCDISMMVHVREQAFEKRGHDLSFVTLRAVDEMPLPMIAAKLNERKVPVKQKKDPVLGLALKVTDHLGPFLVKPALRFISWWTTQIGLPIPFLRLSSYPFGSVIVTQIGSFGLRKGLVPLVPISQAIMLVSVGEVHEAVVAVDGVAVVRPMLTLGVTLDHRFIDGAHAGHIAKIIQSYLENPQSFEA